MSIRCVLGLCLALVAGGPSPVLPGPLDRRAPASPAVNGFASPGSLGSGDANSNFSY